MAPSKPPVAKRVPHERTFHGDTVVDEWHWLIDRDDPDVLSYLQAENDWTEAATAHLAPLREELFEEIRSHVQETDLSVPVKRGPWWYVTRTEEGLQYPIVGRRPGPDDEAGEQVLLDANELAGDSPYFALGVASVSPDHRLLAFSTDHDGDESYVLRFKDLDSGEMLAEEIPGTYYSSAWASDSRTLFYTTIDDANRPHRLWRHAVGTPAAADVLVHEEHDERFFLTVGLTRSEDWIVLGLGSNTTSEVHLLPAASPEGTFQVVEPRRQGVEYHLEHQGERFVIVSNDGHEDFALFEAPVTAPGRAGWRELWAPGPGVRVVDVDAFRDQLVVFHRRDALTHLRVIPNDGEPYDIAFDEAVRTVEPGENAEYDATTYRLGYESLVTPPTVYDFDLTTRELAVRKQQPVPGYDQALYESGREWAPAGDGVEIPISVVRRKDVPLDGSAPALLYGYGSYEHAVDPYFSAIRLPLLDRGFVFAIAHVRGGGEGGRQWYEQGKLLHKRTTFTDFVRCAEHLCRQGWTAPAKLGARGGSAGGLLMGAVANLAPEQFGAIVAEVPFVDALNTILDPSLPLTVIEWEEWGNPVESEAVYWLMKGYSPYENVEAKPYPALLVTAGLNDPRVGYHEPAKWVAKLRATATGDKPILLKTELGAGHGGPSGRYDAWRDQAFIEAFLIDNLA